MMHQETPYKTIQRTKYIVQVLNDINIIVISDDTDVFVLLVHFTMTMEATAKERKSIGIQATAHLHKDIVGQLSTALGLSGCDTVAQLWGIGEKTRVVKVLKAGRRLSELGNSIATLADVVRESAAFIAAYYGYEEASTISDVRFKMWKVKTAKANIVSALKLMSLPPTNASFQPNVPIAHLQCCI